MTQDQRNVAIKSIERFDFLTKKITELDEALNLIEDRARSGTSACTIKIGGDRMVFQSKEIDQKIKKILVELKTDYEAEREKL